MTPRKQPGLSVILPFRNEAPFLESCLLSLSRQKGVDFELIGVDDGSTDGSDAVFSSMAGRFTHPVYVKTEGLGLVRALNRGVEEAKGSIIARADGDDVYHPHRLALQMERLEQGADLVGCLTCFFPRSRVQGGFRTYESWINGLCTREEMEREIFVENPIPHPTLVLRRSLLEGIGGYREMEWPEDWDLVLRAFRAGAVMDKVPKRLHFWREHEDRLCRVHPHYGQLAFIRCRCRHLARGPLAGGRSVFIWGAGPLGRKMTTHLRNEKVSVDGFIDIDPKKIGRIVRDRPVHPPEYLESHRAFVLGCVGKRGARYDIRAALLAMGYVERRDFLLAS
jgi:hypothetical protein